MSTNPNSLHEVQPDGFFTRGLAEADPARLYPSGDGAFEFERTASRLQEMRSADWLTDRS